MSRKLSRLKARRAGSTSPPPKYSAQNSRFLADRECPFDAIEMADIVAKFTDRGLPVGSLERDVTRRRRQKPGQHAQQAGLADTVRTGQLKASPLLDRKRELLEHGAATANASQVLDAQSHVRDVKPFSMLQSGAGSKLREGTFDANEA